MTDTAPFLAAIPVLQAFAQVGEAGRYRAVPDGWALALGDIVSSGQAIAAGRYKAVNMAAAALITAITNAVQVRGIPYTFGGDGAAVAVPPEALPAARAALAQLATWIAEDMDLTMRVALVPVAEMRAAGQDLLVARFAPNADITFALFAGGGSAWAEAKMKAGRFTVDPAPPGARPDLTGLSCRWNPVPAQRGRILSLIVLPAPDVEPAAFQGLVMDLVATASAQGGTGSPIPAEGPVPTLNLEGMEPETRARAAPGRRLGYKLKVIVAVVLSSLLYRWKMTLGGFDMHAYTRGVAANSDFRKFDDGLKMTLDIDEAGLASLRARLDRALADGTCRYGLHLQDAALITCLVASTAATDHVHFIDGAGGGYAEAARQMKAAAG